MSLLMVRKSAPAHAADAAPEFKVGDKIWVDPSYGANLNIGYGWNVGVVKRVGTGYIDVDFKGQVISVPAPYCARVNSSGKPVFDSAAGASVDSNAEAIVNHDRIPVDQLGGEANARKHGYIIAQKGGRVYGVHIDGYSDKLAKKTIEEAGYTVVGDAAEGAAKDRGDYTTNIEALLKTAYSALNKAESVVRVVLRNISNAFDKVQDAQTKSSLNNMEKDWSACEREVWAALEKVERIYVPSNYGIPHKAKLSPEDRKFIEAFFG